MPLFDFLCDRCGTRFEELVASATTTVHCDTCGEEARKLPSAFAVGAHRGGSTSTRGAASAAPS